MMNRQTHLLAEAIPSIFLFNMHILQHSKQGPLHTLDINLRRQVAVAAASVAIIFCFLLSSVFVASFMAHGILTNCLFIAC